MSRPLDDLSDEELERRMRDIRARRYMRENPHGPTATGLSMEDVMGMGWTCEDCRPEVRPGKIIVRLAKGRECPNCGRVG